MNDLKVMVVRAPWHDGIEVLIRDEYSIKSAGHERADIVNVAEITLKEIKRGQVIRPTFSMNMNDAQALMDDLWSAGIRPTEGSGSAGSLRATEKHLSDMRMIVGKKLGVEFNSGS